MKTDILGDNNLNKNYGISLINQSYNLKENSISNMYSPIN